ncbi:hypothetical protein C9J01_00045 [Photobacterium rosenbergii]|uniref:Acid phosphatase n=1 Tax=Photobacterium rosenbergii TaxID=294936 RepID=A0A2T3NIZ5_9GAMM|nr:hypothetical protein [Photobacterium rosenbergii]PSW15450.1 hypothetical protein C9J01_00045 [Photobacterium rosenbergii]
MKKVTLLAASVAIALTGCGGGSDSNSNNGGNTGTPDIPAPGGAVVITGFDGYFKNAVVFVDNNNDGKWNDGDTFLDVTDAKGQIKQDKKPSGTLALQTVTPGGDAQKRLLTINKDKYAGTYTVDMDHESQPMAHELVFRAPNSSDVISPITDLVAIEMAAGKTETEAKQAVSEALGEADESALYSNFIEGTEKDAELHKTAQILTESKAANTSYEDKAIDFAKQADAIVEDMVDKGENINDVNIKPVIVDKNDGNSDASFDPEVITNIKLFVDNKVFKTAQDAFPTIEENENFGGATLDITGLFVDEDRKVDGDRTVAIIPELEDTLEETGINVSLSNDGTMLTLDPVNPVVSPGKYTITLTAQDIDSEGNVVGTSSAVFKVEVKSENFAPVVVDAQKEAIQKQVNSWYLQQGEAVDLTLDIKNLFTDNDGTIAGYEASDMTIAGLNLSVDNNGIVAVSGIPLDSYKAGQTFQVAAKDDNGAKTWVTFTLPEVKEGKPVAHPLEGKTWYKLEYGSSDGDDSDGLDYSRVWCDSNRFEGGKIYSNERNMDNKTECSAANIPYEGASYRVEGDMIIATWPSEDGSAKTMEETYYTVATDADYISDGAKVVLYSEEDGNEKITERYTWYSNIDHAEARLDIQSDAGPEGRDYPMYVPASQDSKYAEGRVSLQMSNAEGESKVSVFIDTAVGETFDCDNLDEFYRSFNVTADDMDGNGGHYDLGSTCNESGAQGVAIGFIMPDLVEGQKYSIIGKIHEDQGEYMEAIKFNMVWTGTGNND